MEEMEALKAKIENLVQENSELLVVNSKSYAEATERSCKFLNVNSKLSYYLLEYEVATIKMHSLTEMELYRALQSTTDKTITERKMACITIKSYREAKEAYEILVEECDWIKTNIKIFQDAHILFRKLVGGG